MEPPVKAPVFEAGARSRTLYLHVFDWPKGGVLDVPMKAEVVKAVLLAAPDAALAVAADGAHTRITVPAAAPDAVATVLRLDLRGAPVIAPAAVADAVK